MSRKLFIIGNGFDLHHGLHSAYNDYKKFLQQTAPEMVEAFEELVSDKRPGDMDPWKNVEGAFNLDYDYIFDCILSYNNLAEPDRENPEDYEEQLKKAVSDTTSFVSSFVKRFFVDWVHCVSRESCLVQDDITVDAEDLFVSFNYTRTLENLYGVDEQKILHIHGSVGGDLQFGTSQISLSTIQRQIEDERNRTRNYEEPMVNAVGNFMEDIELCFKDIKRNYSILRDFINGAEINEVEIMGASLGLDDMPYYTDILVPAFRDKRWIFRCHGDADNRAAIDFVLQNDISNWCVRAW